jgi:hypothetical protein
MEHAVIAMERLTVCGVKQTRFYFFIFWLLDHGHGLRVTYHHFLSQENF